MAPRDELEQRLAGIWTDLLGITPIGVLDSFFELGGESLAAMQLLSRLRDDYDVDLPLGQLFKEATVALLADMIRQLAGTGCATRSDSGAGGGRTDRRPRGDRADPA